MDISLALGGGGAKGNSHIGVIRRLEQEGFRIRAIAGTSFGGIVGAVYAAGYSVDEIEASFCEVDQSRLYQRRAEDGPSFLGLAGVEQWLIRTLGERTFEDLRIPLAVTAVDLNSASEVILSKGRLRDALLATIAVPAIFTPFRTGDMELVDGGIFDPVPVSTARSLAPRLPVIAVELSGSFRQTSLLPAAVLPIPEAITRQLTRLRTAQAINVFLRSMETVGKMLGDMRLRLEPPDVIIRPDVNDVGLLDMVDVHAVALRGEAAVEAVLPELKRLASWSNRLKRSLLRG